jgi:long-chain acyl-CoA synthetase
MQINWADTAVLQYTGGTTGLAKAAVLTQKNLCTMLQRYEAWLHDGVKGQDSDMSASPLFHILGRQVGMNFSIHMGWRNVLLPRATPKPCWKRFVNIGSIIPHWFLLTISACSSTLI